MDEAFAEADRLGALEQETDSDSGHTYGGRPCRWEYVGVRRLAECIDFEEGPPQSGREVTCLSYFLEDEHRLERLLQKRSARLLMDGDDVA